MLSTEPATKIYDPGAHVGIGPQVVLQGHQGTHLRQGFGHRSGAAHGGQQLAELLHVLVALVPLVDATRLRGDPRDAYAPAVATLKDSTGLRFHFMPGNVSR